jgi:hypothetical protein
MYVHKYEIHIILSYSGGVGEGGGAKHPEWEKGFPVPMRADRKRNFSALAIFRYRYFDEITEKRKSGSFCNFV